MKENIIEVVLGIVQNKVGKVLVVHRKDEEYAWEGSKLSWVFPGGKPELGETLSQAIEREVLEETGYKVRAGEVISERTHSQFPAHLTYFACYLIADDPIQQAEADEIKERLWLEANKLTSYFTSDLDIKVARYLNIRI